MDLSKNRIRSFDILKGIAIICVILGHLGIENVDRIVYTFHVPVFYFVMGYFINTNQSFSELLKKKIKTLLVPYWITALIMIILAIIAGAILGECGTMAKTWIFAALYGSGENCSFPFCIDKIGAIWFLYASFWGSLFVNLIMKVNARWRAFVVIAVFLCGYMTKDMIWLPFSIQAGAVSVLFIYIGYIIKHLSKLKSNIEYLQREEIRTACVILAFVIWLDFIYNFKGFYLVEGDIGRGVTDVFGSICAYCVLLTVCRYIDKKCNLIARYLSFVGKNSILLLCLHNVELNLFPWGIVLNYLDKLGVGYTLTMLIIVTIKMILLMVLLYLLQKNRIVQWMFSLNR